MLKLEDSAPCESLGPGSISKIDNINMGGSGGDQFTLSEKSRNPKQNSQDICPGLWPLLIVPILTVKQKKSGQW